MNDDELANEMANKTSEHVKEEITTFLYNCKRANRELLLAIVETVDKARDLFYNLPIADEQVLKAAKTGMPLEMLREQHVSSAFDFILQDLTNGIEKFRAVAQSSITWSQMVSIFRSIEVITAEVEKSMQRKEDNKPDTQ